MIEGIDILERCGGQLGWKWAVKSDRNRCSLLEHRIRLRTLVLVLVVIPNLWTENLLSKSFRVKFKRLLERCIKSSLSYRRARLLLCTGRRATISSFTFAHVLVDIQFKIKKKEKKDLSSENWWNKYFQIHILLWSWTSVIWQFVRPRRYRTFVRLGNIHLHSVFYVCTVYS